MSDQRLEGFLLRDGWVQGRAELRRAIAAANELAPTQLSDDEVNDLLAFLHALTDPSSAELPSLIPESVPSGLPVED